MSIIYCVGTSDYDTMMVDDSTVNCMADSLQQFKALNKSGWFSNTLLILFLNKNDLLKEKAKVIDLSVCFPEYKGGLNYDNALKYIDHEYRKVIQERKKDNFYVHVTCAIDSKNIKDVFAAVKKKILDKIIDTVLL
mmetsp:Transcript_25851/g.28744  ORF Transcript_25851/g.28744 Transcript_25851/m.28744 type:complete len:136 (+) Transcript_25851:50-457(+)